MSKAIHFLPIENMEQRYTRLMNTVVSPFCSHVYYPTDFVETKIAKGQFLDVERTIEFKSKQLAMVSRAFQEGKVNDGDSFLIGDLFFPGIESIKYMAELQGIKVRIVGFNYAGRADSTDFVQGLGYWADYAEKMYHEVADLILVGSEFHKKQVVDYFELPEHKVVATGYVWNAEEAYKVYPHIEAKEEFVIYPHRLCREKGFDDFVSICEHYPEMKFVVTSSGNRDNSVVLPQNADYISGLTKQEYYKMMSRAKYYLSTAFQETFGYTVQEAIMYNCIIAVPRRACYEEVVAPFSIYDSVEDIKNIFSSGKTHESSAWKSKFANNVSKIMELV